MNTTRSGGEKGTAFLVKRYDLSSQKVRPFKMKGTAFQWVKRQLTVTITCVFQSFYY